MIFFFFNNYFALFCGQIKYWVQFHQFTYGITGFGLADNVAFIFFSDIFPFHSQHNYAIYYKLVRSAPFRVPMAKLKNAHFRDKQKFDHILCVFCTILFNFSITLSISAGHLLQLTMIFIWFA